MAELKKLRESEKALNEEVKVLSNANRKLMVSNRRKASLLSAAKKKIRFLMSKKYTSSLIKARLAKFRTKAYVMRALNPNRKHPAKYDQEDVTIATVLRLSFQVLEVDHICFLMIFFLIFRSMCSRAFSYLRSKNIIALPSKATVEKWLRHFKVGPDIQRESLSIFHEMSLAVNQESDCYAAISFDEINMKKVVEYDQRLKQVFARHLKCQVVTARGLIND